MKWILTLLALGLLGLFFLTTDFQLLNSRSPSAVGRVVAVEGHVMGQANEDESFVNLEAGATLTPSHHIKTGLSGKVRLSYGEEFLVLPQSSVRLNQRGKEQQIYLLSGEIQRSKPSDSTQFFVENKSVSGQTIKHRPFLAAPEVQEAGKGQPENLQKSGEQTILRDTFRLHQRFLEKCFIKHYQRKEGLTQDGQILIGFAIRKNGKLDEIEIKKSPYDDDELNSCIKEVVSRIRIRHYKGESTLVEFPIRFSLPH